MTPRGTYGPLRVLLTTALLFAGGCRMRIGNEWALWLMLALPLVIALMIVSFNLKLRTLSRFAEGVRSA